MNHLLEWQVVVDCNCRRFNFSPFYCRCSSIYNGSRGVLSLSKWIAQFLPIQVKDLDAESLQKDVLTGTDIWLLDYYAPWCGHCQALEPHFVIAAQLLEAKVRLGRLNCDIHRQECSRAGIRAYPTLILYTEKKGKRTLHSGHQIAAVKAENIVHEVLENLHKASSKNHDEL